MNASKGKQKSQSSSNEPHAIDRQGIDTESQNQSQIPLKSDSGNFVDDQSHHDTTQSSDETPKEEKISGREPSKKRAFYIVKGVVEGQELVKVVSLFYNKREEVIEQIPQSRDDGNLLLSFFKSKRNGQKIDRAVVSYRNTNFLKQLIEQEENAPFSVALVNQRELEQRLLDSLEKCVEYCVKQDRRNFFRELKKLVKKLEYVLDLFDEIAKLITTQGESSSC